MKILVNAASAHMGGAVTYLQNILRWVPDVASCHQFYVCLPEATAERLAEYETGSNVEFIRYPYQHTSGISRLYFDHVIIPAWVRQWDIDVLFSSTGFGTFWSPCPEVLLIRNPVYFNKDFHAKYRELNRSLMRTTLRRWYSLLSIQCADSVLFPTEAMQSMVGEYIDLTDKPTEAIHYGFDRERFCAETGQTPEWTTQIQRWKEQGDAILLNVSTYAVHKNFETLIEALALLRRDDYPVKLVTTTSRQQTSDKTEYDSLLQSADDWGVSDAWIELGYIPYNQLNRLYALADLYVFPSFTESFGHTMVEAMATARPVVAADAPVNREVCGSAGVFFDTFDAQDCASILKRLIQDHTKQTQLAKRAEERAAHFSWKKYVQTLTGILEQTAATNTHSKTAV